MAKGHHEITKVEAGSISYTPNLLRILLFEIFKNNATVANIKRRCVILLIVLNNLHIIIGQQSSGEAAISRTNRYIILAVTKTLN